MNAITPNEAALLVGVSPITIRQWRRRGHLPESFTVEDVWRCHAARLTERRKAQIEAAWEASRHAA
jgi:predicted site-specific integrase-resolvase